MRNRFAYRYGLGLDIHAMEYTTIAVHTMLHTAYFLHLVRNKEYEYLWSGKDYSKQATDTEYE